MLVGLFKLISFQQVINGQFRLVRVSTLEIIFLHFVAKHLRHQDTKTQR
jgi:hypothetical protein